MSCIACFYWLIRPVVSFSFSWNPLLKSWLLMPPTRWAPTPHRPDRGCLPCSGMWITGEAVAAPSANQIRANVSLLPRHTNISKYIKNQGWVFVIFVWLESTGILFHFIYFFLLYTFCLYIFFHKKSFIFQRRFPVSDPCVKMFPTSSVQTADIPFHFHRRPS